MKIGMLTSVGEKCGIASYTRALMEALNEIDVVSIEVVPITPGRQPIEHYREQADILNSEDIDVVHIQHEYSFWGSVLPKRWGYWELRYLLKKPIVLTAHTTYDLADLLHLKTEKSPIKRIAKKLLLRREAYRDSIEIAPFVTAMTIVHTAAARNELISRGAKPNFVTVIPSGTPSPLKSIDGGAGFRKKYNLTSRRTVTIFGYVTYNKGYEPTFDILAALPSDVVLVIAGGARTPDMEPYVSKLQEMIAAKDLAERVVITGYLSDNEVADAMEASDIVLVPHTEAGNSYSVSFPLAYGRPVLASNLACFDEIAQRVDCIQLFEASNPDDYLLKLQALLQDEGRREKLSTNALKYAARFSWPKVAKSTVDVYRSAIEIYSAGHHPHCRVL